ncbi:hypothetical protein A2996_00050 [Candidatus Campbellbacteria bacterium RIFCSPLOWO2_01_FULL_34_15]|uniref:Uncharacterized protein n=2 Tax=Candidatus Campbelliibacteriota TaxID=1752727 RepID=A0A1F5EML2_9BACT|nr:MAG: hypothetical protein A2996_00050 [Candidatus Campbellbacteria bacterium RIFCSPLOWO2_01_FULL_34_15]OGD68717.1 MAG: hypothetical protein A2811_02870 [Candidatus Campbellbacteria bacterium RIFCSPHIGHO2_01_FULL_34_10]
MTRFFIFSHLGFVHINFLMREAMDIFSCSKDFLFGEEITFCRDLGEIDGIECIGLVLDLNRIAILFYSYDLASGERKCSFEGISQDKNWKPKFCEKVIVNKNVLVSPSIPEITYVSDFCIRRFNISANCDIFEMVRNELYPSQITF